MKLCPQCEFIYEDDQSLCDMDGKELVNSPSSFAFEESVPVRSAQLDDGHTAAALALSPSLTAGLTPSPVGAPASVPVNLVSRRQPRNLAVAALAGLVLMALLFVVYYARTRQSHTRNANRPSSQSNSQSPSQPATQPTDTQPSAPDSESAQSLGETTASDQPLAQPLEQSSDQSSAETGSPGLTPAAQTSHALPPASERSLLRGRPTANPVSARALAETSRATVVIRLTNGASIKADEAWEKKEGIWYRQAGMVTFVKRSRVRSIQRLAPSNRNQMEARPQTSIAQNQPRVAKPEIIKPKNESRMTSFLKKTGRILKKPFKL